MRKSSFAFAALALLHLASCTTVSGESPGFLQSMQQVVGAASMAVGVKYGDTNLAQNGANMFSEGLGAGSGTAPVAPAPGPQPVATQADAGGSNQDLQAIANRCDAIAGSRYGRQAQNVLLQRAACLSLCAYSVTNIQRYYQMYQENQRNANSLCSVGIASNCNDIDQGYCQYH